MPDCRTGRPLLRCLLLAPVLALVFTWPALAPTDPDYWMHERTGRLIADTGTVPHVDPYSFTAAGRPWIDHEWLSQLLFYAVQRQLGYVGNVVLLGVLGCLAVVALYATCRRWGVGELPAVVLVVWAFGMSLGSFGVRPQALTRVLLTVLALLLTVYRQGGNPWLLVLVPPLFVVWTNLHGGVAVGLGLLGLTVAGDAFDALRARSLRGGGAEDVSPEARAECPRPAAARPLAATLLASVAAVLLTPNGGAGLLYPLAFAFQATGGQQLIAEWQPPDLRQIAFAPFGLSLLLAFALGWIRRPPLRAAEALWAIAFALLALQSVRNVQLYAMVVTPLIGARLRAEFPAFGRTVAEWRNPRRLAALWTATALVLGGVWLARFAQSADRPVQLGAEPSAAALPVGGAAYVREHDLQGNLFSQFDWGGYLIYANYPRQRVFIDGRSDVYGQALVDDYVSVVEVLPNWRQVLDKYSIQLVLVDRDGPLAVEIGRDPQWHQLYVGPVERLLQRGPRPA
jgi:hypothetical protein